MASPKALSDMRVRDLMTGNVTTLKRNDNLSVADDMTSSVVTTSPDAPLREAAQLMNTHKLGCLPVVEGGKLVGILTEGDFVALAAGS